MGGHETTELGRQRRPLPRRALLLMTFGMAFGVLAGSAFLCARPGTQAVTGAEHASAHASARASAHASARASALASTGAPPRTEHVFCVSPYDLPGCSSCSHLTPAVLPAPPPAVVVVAGAPVPVVRPAPAGRIRPPPALARGPDLYALQVLRT
ncbi:hypothetical protein [Streptomyces sp. NBC_00096]|uniref:hypothetical protein n=1 Tax=Streptomyces sp. NBC_00096 TaxID=2975650 RepID=UPI0032484174